MSRTVPLLGTLALLLATWFPGLAAAQPSVSLSPSAGPPGTVVTLSAATVTQLGGLGQCSGAQTAGGGLFVGPGGTVNFSTTLLPNGGATFQVPTVSPGSYNVFFYTCAGMSGSPPDSGAYATFTVTAAPAQSVNVSAATPWNNTGITVSAGDQVSITATGTINDGSIYPQNATSGPAGLGVVSADGYSCTSNVNNPQPEPYLVAGVPCESLVGAIVATGGTPPTAPAQPSSTVFEVGSQDSFTAAASGTLYLSVNDNYFPDNSGQFTAEVAVTPPTLPTAAVTPGTGPAGTPFIITGSGFGQATGTVEFAAGSGGTAAASVNSWNNNYVIGTVPAANLPYGATNVVVTTAQGTTMPVGSFNLVAGVVPSLPQCASVLTVGSPAAIFEDSGMVTLPVSPLIRNSRTFVPVDFVKGVLGAQVAWNGSTDQVTSTQAGTVIVMTIGQTQYTVNGQTENMDVAPFIQSPGYTMVPVSFIDNALGLVTGWLPLSRQVVIDTGCG